MGRRYGHLEVILQKDIGRPVTGNPGLSVLCACHLCGGCITMKASVLPHKANCGCKSKEWMKHYNESGTVHEIVRVLCDAGSDLGQNLLRVRCRRCGNERDLLYKNLRKLSALRCVACRRKFKVGDRLMSVRETAEELSMSVGSICSKASKMNVPAEEMCKQLLLGKVSLKTLMVPMVGTVLNGRVIVRVGKLTDRTRPKANVRHWWKCNECGLVVKRTARQVRLFGCPTCQKNRLKTKVELAGELVTLYELSELYSVNRVTLAGRLRNGWTLPQALGLHPPPAKKK